MMARAVVIAVLLVPLLAGCVSAVRLRNPQTGEVVKCGPYPAWTYVGPRSAWSEGGAPAVDPRQARCIEEYAKRGYVPLARSGGS